MNNRHIEPDKLSLLKSYLHLLPLKPQETLYFKEFIDQLIAHERLINTLIGLQFPDITGETLPKWQELLANIPGFDFAGISYIIDNDSPELLKKGVVMLTIFAPSLSYNSISSNNGYEVWFKNNGLAEFWFPTFEDARQYPELYNFKGTWKEAYLLLIETLKKGWPMEEFPVELLPLLKK